MIKAFFSYLCGLKSSIDVLRQDSPPSQPSAATTGLPPVEFDALLITFKYHWDEIALFYSGG